jgi:hypothetical protein
VKDLCDMSKDTFYILCNYGYCGLVPGWVEVENAEKLVVDGYEEWEFFLYYFDSPGMKYWKVCEAMSGICMIKFDEKEKALTKAKHFIDYFDLQEKVKNHIMKYGISPRYLSKIHNSNTISNMLYKGENIVKEEPDTPKKATLFKFLDI